jgi:putative protease
MQQIKRRKAGSFTGAKPEILAPAGNRDAFLAALAAGADAVYCGMKSFSARMAAQNFSFAELAGLAELARTQKTKLYLTVNTLVKPDELQPLGRRLTQLVDQVMPDALIVQDLAVVDLAKQAGYKGEIHLSTLANVSQPNALAHLHKTFGVQRVVLPRELDVDEIKQMAEACPSKLGLEVFVHGALCYGVSGRCYWSSFLGGKSGLRGRCVQPCRRRYAQFKERKRYFACQDFSLDVLVKALTTIPQIRAWKIEGRKKGPHYVYYTTTAYKMLRDEGHDPQAKKAALRLLDQALGRPRTHYAFLPQRPQNPIDTGGPSASGLLVGAVKGGREKAYLSPRIPLLAHDKLRVGYEDDPWHQTLSLSKAVPKGGKFFLKPVRGRSAANGTSVFLIDRRESALDEQIQALARRLADVDGGRSETDRDVRFKLRLPTGRPKKPRTRNMHVLRGVGRRMRQTSLAMWLDLALVKQLPVAQRAATWWWLPPVIWPNEEAQWNDAIRMLLKQGAHRFMLNAPWQIDFFKPGPRLSLWAGPFCNLSNPLAVRAFQLMGGNGVVVSPELGRDDLLALGSNSVLPLGVVLSGFWPFCVSRVVDDGLKTHQPFVSPKGEQGWVRRHGNLHWVYPNWTVDLRAAQKQLIKAGYRLFVHLDEPIPKHVTVKRRPGKWNWEHGLK